MKIAVGNVLVTRVILFPLREWVRAQMPHGPDGKWLRAKMNASGKTEHPLQNIARGGRIRASQSRSRLPTSTLLTPGDILSMVRQNIKCFFAWGGQMTS